MWRRKLDPLGEVGIVHLNPVYDAGRRDVRRLSASVPTAGIRDAEDLPAFERHAENHLGEMINDADGRTAYLKTFRLSQAQIRRGYLISRLAEHDWSLPATAATLGTDTAALGLRLVRAGFGHLLRQDVLDGYRKARR